MLEQEATREGTLYRGLETRLADVKASLPPDGSRAEAYTAVAEELTSLAAAADPTEFNRALGDPLNVLADLSDGALPRVDAVSASASRAANGASDFGPGSQLVGNPNYGQWRTESSGTSFWVWYGQFALMRDLLGGRALATAPGPPGATTATTMTMGGATTPRQRPALAKPAWHLRLGASSHRKGERSTAPTPNSAKVRPAR